MVLVASTEARILTEPVHAEPWGNRVVVGEPAAQTPLFDSALKYIVFNPTWTVPRKIASEELLPKIQRDNAFLDRGRYQVVDSDGNSVDADTIDWNALASDYFPYTLVQQPGPVNELGQVKFIFPNQYAVCMHDTPSKPLFDRAQRAFSHGCIRVDRPLELAEKLLDGEGWTRARIEQQIESAETKSVFLAEPLPVRLAYWTADVDDRGVMHFYPDIYARDPAILELLDGP